MPRHTGGGLTAQENTHAKGGREGKDMSTEQAGVGVSAGSKRLFTPGPLNTTSAVKAAMLLDCGSRDGKFLICVYAHEYLY